MGQETWASAYVKGVEGQIFGMGPFLDTQAVAKNNISYGRLIEQGFDPNFCYTVGITSQTLTNDADYTAVVNLTVTTTQTLDSVVQTPSATVIAEPFVTSHTVTADNLAATILALPGIASAEYTDGAVKRVLLVTADDGYIVALSGFSSAGVVGVITSGQRGDLLGVSYFTQNQVNDSGNAYWTQDTDAGILSEGKLDVIAQEAVTKKSKVYAGAAGAEAGLFYASTTGSDDRIFLAHARWKSAAGVGEIAHLQVNFPQAATE